MRATTALPSRLAGGELGALWTHRRALAAVARYSLQRHQAGTTGGLAWTFLAPLVPLLVVSTLFAVGLKLPLGGAPYAFGFAAGFVPWVLVSGAVAAASGSLVDHRYLVKRTHVPLAIVPASAVIVHSIPHTVALVIVGLACGVAGYGHLPDLLAVLYFYACAALFSLSAGLLLSALAVVARDLQHLLPSLLQVWFWITPIAWSATVLPAPLASLLALNPATYLVAGYRYALMPTVFAPPSWAASAAFWVVCLATLLLGTSCFRRLRPYFWDCL
jgi:ABC-type polysaccharide/polyol phosphate export permease